MSVDDFLRAMQRDVAWDFFYGTVNFDAVVGTVNHYGTVDLFAGKFNETYRTAERDYFENFQTPNIRETFKSMLDDWTIEGFDPFASPAETDKPFGVKSGSNTEAVTRRRVAANRMVGVPGDEVIRTDETHPINRMFADVAQDEPSRRRWCARDRRLGRPGHGHGHGHHASDSAGVRGAMRLPFVDGFRRRARRSRATGSSLGRAHVGHHRPGCAATRPEVV